jgi:mannose-6-phosphate isomerase-like protein (cupin superfamily)
MRTVISHQFSNGEIMSEQNQKAFIDKQLTEKYDYLAPDGSEIRLLPEVGGGGLAHCTLPPGKVSSAVVHRTVEEIWYFISGQGQVWRKLDDLEKIAEATLGWSLTIPAGTHFQFRNTGNEPLCFVIATSPRWPGAHEAVPVQGKWETE